MKNNMWKIATILFASSTLVGCATVMGQSAAETLNVRSMPDQASVIITDESGTKVFEGKTPTTLPLEKKKGYFSGKKYSVSIKKDGYEERTVTVDTKANGWYIAGNLVFGGLIGWLIVDPATGAMWTLNANEIDVALEAPMRGTSIRSDARVVLLDDIPLSLHGKMVEIVQ